MSGLTSAAIHYTSTTAQVVASSLWLERIGAQRRHYINKTESKHPLDEPRNFGGASSKRPHFFTAKNAESAKRKTGCIPKNPFFYVFFALFAVKKFDTPNRGQYGLFRR
jgi:hypothetical protein